MSSKSISSMAQTTSFEDADLFLIVDDSASANRKATLEDLMDHFHAQQKWNLIDTADYTATPTTEEFDGSTFNNVSDWAAATGYTAGDFVKPATANGYIYECVTNGTSGGAEPAFGTTIGADTADNTTSWRCRGLHVVTTSADLTGSIAVGSPLKYVYSSTTFYGMCVGITASRIAVAGAPMLSNVNLSALSFGQPERVVQVTMWKDGDFDGGVADVVIEPQLKWQLADAYLVSAYIAAAGDDTGADNAQVNVEVGGSAVFRNDGDDGYSVATSFVESSYVDINVSNYKIERGDALNPTVTAAGSNGDGTDLSIVCAFVLE
jgi:hypothetical protein